MFDRKLAGEFVADFARGLHYHQVILNPSTFRRLQIPLEFTECSLADAAIFNKLYKKVEKDDLNLPVHGDKLAGKGNGKEPFGKMHGVKSHRGDTRSRMSNPHMDTFYINVGKIDNIHPGILVDLLAGHAGLMKRQIGDIEIHKKHCLVEVDKKFSKFMESGKILKFKGRRVVIKKEAH